MIRELVARPDALPVEAWVVWKRVSHSFSQHGIYSFLLPRKTHCFAASMVILQKAWYAVFALRASGSGNFLARLLVIVPQRFLLALQKFQRFTGLLVVVMQ